MRASGILIWTEILEVRHRLAREEDTAQMASNNGLVLSDVPTGRAKLFSVVVALSIFSSHTDPAVPIPYSVFAVNLVVIIMFTNSPECEFFPLSSNPASRLTGNTH
jgi:hypothetical protein